MSNPSLDQIHGSKAPSVTELVAETRIDSPHPIADLPLFEEDAAAEVANLESGIDLEAWAREEPSSPPPDAGDDLPAGPGPGGAACRASPWPATGTRSSRGRTQCLGRTTGTRHAGGPTLAGRTKRRVGRDGPAGREHRRAGRGDPPHGRSPGRAGAAPGRVGIGIGRPHGRPCSSSTSN